MNSINQSINYQINFENLDLVHCPFRVAGQNNVNDTCLSSRPRRFSTLLIDLIMTVNYQIVFTVSSQNVEVFL